MVSFAALEKLTENKDENSSVIIYSRCSVCGKEANDIHMTLRRGEAEMYATLC